MKKTNYLFIIFLVLLILSGCQNYQTDGTTDTKSMQIELTEQQKLEAEKTPEGMVYVPEGEYLSGAPSWDPYAKETHEADIWPETKVYLSSFYIDKYEVTNSQYQEFISSHPKWQKNSTNKNLDGLNGLNHPVVLVSWYAANAYCEAQGKKLPTSWQWEKAARGTDGRIYPWGNKMESERANICDKSCQLPQRDSSFKDGFSVTSPVGSFVKGQSPFGVFDMTGNVLEWVSDWRDTTDSYYKQLPRENPTGPSEGNRKSQRGGSWLHTDVYLGLMAYQYYSQPPSAVLNYVGFRCAADVK